MFRLKCVGADPEVFIADENDEIISGIGLIGGSKQNPFPVNGGAVQEDNVLGEFNIYPAVTSEEFVANLSTVMNEMQKIIGTKNIKVVSSYEFTKKLLQDAGPKAMEFGCDPDYNCWNGSVNVSPSPFTNLRTAGGHVHVSFNVSNEDVDPFKAAAMMDYYLGLPSLLLDGDMRRREMYGKSGACRPKLLKNGDPYDGVEYRTLSNFWLRSDELMSWVFTNTELAISNMHNFKKFLKSVSAEDIQNIINSGDVNEAKKITNSLSIPLPVGI